jgi:hypothetical protein
MALVAICWRGASTSACFTPPISLSVSANTARQLSCASTCAPAAAAPSPTQVGALSGDAVFFEKPLLHDPHLLRRIFACERKRVLGRPAQPDVEFFFVRE